MRLVSGLLDKRRFRRHSDGFPWPIDETHSDLNRF